MQIESSHCRSTKKAFTAGHVFSIPGFWIPEASELGYSSMGETSGNFVEKPALQLAQDRADRNILKTSVCTETCMTPGLNLSQAVPRDVAAKMLPSIQPGGTESKKEIVALTLFSDLLL